MASTLPLWEKAIPRYVIIPTDEPSSSATVTGPDSAVVLRTIEWLYCKEADVFVEGDYAFSLRRGPSGLWTIFQREGDPDPGEG